MRFLTGKEYLLKKQELDNRFWQVCAKEFDFSGKYSLFSLNNYIEKLVLFYRRTVIKFKRAFIILKMINTKAQDFNKYKHIKIH